METYSLLKLQNSFIVTQSINYGSPTLSSFVMSCQHEIANSCNLSILVNILAFRDGLVRKNLIREMSTDCSVRPQFEFWLCYLLDTWLQQLSVSLNLSFHIVKMEIIIAVLQINLIKNWNIFSIVLGILLGPNN